MAGPWFTVIESGDDWNEMETIWISNGRDHERVRVELQVRLEEARDDGQEDA